MTDKSSKSKPGRPKGSIKRSTDAHLNIFHYVEYRRAVVRRGTGRLPSVARICDEIVRDGGYHEFIAHDNKEKFPRTDDIRVGRLNASGRGVVIDGEGSILLTNSIQSADALRRRHSEAQKFIREHELENMMDNRLRDALGEPRGENSGWAVGWRPATPPTHGL